MPVNLLNEHDLNDYLTRIVFSDGKAPTILPQNLCDISFVEKNRNKIVKSMVLQWLKHRLRLYLTEKTDAPYLRPVTLEQTSLPQWVVDNLNAGRNVHEFIAAQIDSLLHEKITKVCQFLEKMAHKYIDKQLSVAIQEQTPVKLRLEFLKTGNQYRDFEETHRLAETWERAEENRKTHRYHLSEKHRSEIGTERVMDLSDGYYIVRLLTDEAREFESNYMNHCLGKEVCTQSFQSGKMRAYSLRDAKGEPHVTFDIRDRKWDEHDKIRAIFLPPDQPEFSDGIIYQVRGKNDKRPLFKYIPYIQEFVTAYKFGFGLFQACKAGMVYCNGAYRNIFDLPEGAVIEQELDISEMGLTELPDFSTVIVKGIFDCSGNQLRTLKGAPLAVGRDFDCSKNLLETLEGCSRNIGGQLICSINRLKSLRGVPEELTGLLACSYNQLYTLDGFPRKFRSLSICHNPVFDNAFNAIYNGKVPEIFLFDEIRRILPQLQARLTASQSYQRGPIKNFER